MQLMLINLINFRRIDCSYQVLFSSLFVILFKGNKGAERGVQIIKNRGVFKAFLQIIYSQFNLDY